MTFEVKIETDMNDITEHPHDGKPRPYLCTVCDKRFGTKKHLKQHEQTHNVDKLYSCTQCEKRFATQRNLSQHSNVHSKSISMAVFVLLLYFYTVMVIEEKNEI